MDLQVNRRRARLTGGAFVLSGVYLILAGLGFVSVRFSPGVRPWVVVAAGAMFALAGAAIINNSAFGDLEGVGAAKNAPFAARIVGYLLSLAIPGLMCVLFAWIALGSGERHFSSWTSVAGHPLRGQNSERFGRIAFGICAAFLALFLVASAAGGARLFRRRPQDER
jgi:hypothetical protein